MFTLNFALRDADTPSTRAVLIPNNYTFAQLDQLIQLLYGMLDQHVHQFAAHDGSVYLFAGYDDTGFNDAIAQRDNGAVDAFGDLLIAPTAEIWREADQQVAALIVAEQAFTYTYDFGDEWQIDITRGPATDAKPTDTPYVTATTGTDIIENVGGTSGLAHLKDVLQDPSNEEYGDWVAWLRDDEINVPSTMGLNNMIQQFFK